MSDTVARLNAALARAVRAYERYLKIRQDSEPEVMPEVEAVRGCVGRAAGRLSGLGSDRLTREPAGS